jgi:hypothetical protein
MTRVSPPLHEMLLKVVVLIKVIEIESFYCNLLHKCLQNKHPIFALMFSQNREASGNFLDVWSFYAPLLLPRLHNTSGELYCGMFRYTASAYPVLLARKSPQTKRNAKTLI